MTRWKWVFFFFKWVFRQLKHRWNSLVSTGYSMVQFVKYPHSWREAGCVLEKRGVSVSRNICVDISEQGKAPIPSIIKRGCEVPRWHLPCWTFQENNSCHWCGHSQQMLFVPPPRDCTKATFSHVGTKPPSLESVGWGWAISAHVDTGPTLPSLPTGKLLSRKGVTLGLTLKCTTVKAVPSNCAWNCILQLLMTL